MSTRGATRIAGGLAVLSAMGTLLLLGSGFVYQHRGVARSLAEHPPPGQLVEVDGTLMHLHCEGNGSPTVVLENGLGGSAAHWGPTHRAVAASTRACAYDRAGFGYSEPLGRPASVAETAERLHALLDGAGESEPVVLVGFSWGGIIARSVYAQHPDHVAGMVLLDSTHEDSNRAYGDTEHVTPPLPMIIGSWTQPFGLQRLTGIVGKLMSSKTELSDNDRARLTATFGQSHTAQAIVHETQSLDDALFAGRQPPSLGDIPLLVLMRDEKQREDDMDDEEWEQRVADEVIKKSLQESLARLSTRGELRVVEGSGHTIPKDAPKVTVAAILEVVDLCRTGN